MKKNLEQLEKELRDKPWRVVKLIVFALLLLAAITTAITFLSIWQRRRRRAAAEEAARRNPFVDPFEEMPDADDPALIKAVYESFLAYLWVGGLRYKPGQTEFDFATWLEQNSPMDPAAVWCVTGLCTRTIYADTPLTATDRQHLRTAFQAIVQQATGKLSQEEKDKRQQEYLKSDQTSN